MMMTLLSIYLSIYLSVHLCNYPSIHPSIHPSVYLCIYSCLAIQIPREVFGVGLSAKVSPSPIKMSGLGLIELMMRRDSSKHGLHRVFNQHVAARSESWSVAYIHPAASRNISPKGPSTNIMRTLDFYRKNIHMVWAKCSFFEYLDPLGRVRWPSGCTVNTGMPKPEALRPD